MDDGVGSGGDQDIGGGVVTSGGRQLGESQYHRFVAFRGCVAVDADSVVLALGHIGAYVHGCAARRGLTRARIKSVHPDHLQCIAV